MIDPDFSSLTRVAAESRLGRAVAAVSSLVANGWRDSRVNGLLRGAAREILSWPAYERVRTVLLVLAFSGIGHWGLLVVVVPPYVAPGIPPAVFLGLGLIALGMAAAAPGITEAWPHSAIGRLTSWLVT